MQVYLCTFYRIKIFLMGMFIHLKIDFLLPSTQKDMQECILSKAISFLHERCDGDFAQPFSLTVPQEALNAILGHE